MRVGKLCCNLDREYFSGALEQESPDIPWAYQNSKVSTAQNTVPCLPTKLSLVDYEESDRKVNQRPKP